MKYARLVAFFCIFVACRWVAISGTSMQPSLRDGDFVRVCAITDSTQIDTGSVITFRLSSRSRLLVKRVQGIPGDSLNASRPVPSWVTWKVIPKGFYYVRSDRYSAKYDSRRFGLVPRHFIEGIMTQREEEGLSEPGDR